MENTRIPYRKTYEIVGWTRNGAAYCIDHSYTMAVDSETDPEINPVFLDQADDLICDECFERLDQ